MTPHYIQVRPGWTVQHVFDHIKNYGKKAETLTYIYVVDKANKLINELKIGQLLIADYSTPISKLMDYNFISIPTTTPMEEGFHIFQKYDRFSIPIITENGILVGIVTFNDIINKIKERDTEDIQKFGGVKRLDLSYTKTPWFELVRKRAGWLVILFLGEMLTASAMGYFDSGIERAVVLALFVPLII
jgi:magnesium transporter